MSRQIPSSILARYPRFAELDYKMVELIMSESRDSRHSYGSETRSAEIENETIFSGLLHALSNLDEKTLKEKEGKQKP